MALIVGAIVNMTSTLPAQADHGASSSPFLFEFKAWTPGSAASPQDLLTTADPLPAGITDKCSSTDLRCAVTYGPNTTQVVLGARPGKIDTANNNQHVHSPTSDNLYVVQVGRLDFPNPVDAVDSDADGLKFALAEGPNLFRVTVVSKIDPNVNQVYEVTVTRTPDTRPAFADPKVKHNSFRYGYAENLMKYHDGDKNGSASIYNHPSDGQTVDTNSGVSFYRKDSTNKRFIRGDATFTSPQDAQILSYTAIIAEGKSPEVEATNDTQRARYTGSVNLSDGIVIIADQKVGAIDFPRASGGNSENDNYTYNLVQVGRGGTEDNEMPDGLSKQWIVWNDSDGNSDGKVDSNELTYSETDPQDGVVIGMRLKETADADLPKTDSGNDARSSQYPMVYRAHDADEADGTDGDHTDAAEIFFIVTIQKNLVTAPPADGTTPGVSDLTGLTVATAGSSVTVAANTPRESTDAEMVSPDEFDADVTSYRWSIPYEREKVEILAKVADNTKTTVSTVHGDGSAIIPYNATREGYVIESDELSEGSNAPIRIRVAPSDSTSTVTPKIYSVIISRDYNSPAQFDTSEKPADLNFYDGVAIEAVGLPEGRLGNGSPDESATATDGEWRYELSLEARYDGAGTSTAPSGYPYGTTDGYDDTTNLRPQKATWLPAANADPPGPGFEYTVEWDVDAKDATRQLAGTPRLLNNDARSAKSDFSFLYVAKDGDLDDTPGDNAEHRFAATVWRNVLLKTLKVDTTPGTASATDTVYDRANPPKNNKPYTLWNKAATYNYSFTVNHDIDQVTVSAENMWTSGIPLGFTTATDGVAVTSPADADADTDGHQVDLDVGSTMVTVEVTNGTNVGTHKLNIYRRPLGANPITVTALAGDENIELSPDFNVETLNYDAEVESHQDVVFIEVAITHPNAQVSIENIDTGRSRAKEVDVDPGLNTYRIDVTLGSSQTTYWLNITRKGNAAPSFGSETVTSRSHQVGKALKSCETDGTENSYIMLPAGTEGSGNGALKYSIDATTLPAGVSFNPLTRKLSGTPALREAYERTYEIDYVVSDSDTDTSSDDTDTITFTMTVTHAAVDPCADGPGGTPAAKNHLMDLLVIYDLPALNKTDVEASLTPEFDSAEDDYSVELPYGSSNKRIAAYVHAGATVSLNKVRISHGVHTPLRDGPNVVRVSYPSLPSMDYDLTVTEASQSVPVFSESVSDYTWQTGKAITAMALPVATGGNAPLTYSLADHQNRMPSGLVFDPDTRVLSGTPSLSSVDTAGEAIYVMTYTVSDRDGDTDTDEFRITITTEAQANPGAMPDSLTATKSGTTATLRWNPGDDATAQVVAYLTPSGEIVIDMNVAADANRYTAENLADGTYRYLVVGVDANGMLHFSNPASTD